MDSDLNAIGLVVRGLELLVGGRRDDALVLPTCAEVAGLVDEGAWLEVGTVEGRRWLAAPLAEGATPPPALAFVSARGLFDRLPEPQLELVGQAPALVEFEGMHRHCGRCGVATEPAPAERARRCPAGHGTFHPRIAPAVIVLVVRHHEMLLARNVQFPAGRFSAVAGFVEIGESLESASKRSSRGHPKAKPLPRPWMIRLRCVIAVVREPEPETPGPAGGWAGGAADSAGGGPRAGYHGHPAETTGKCAGTLSGKASLIGYPGRARSWR